MPLAKSHAGLYSSNDLSASFGIWNSSIIPWDLAYGKPKIIFWMAKLKWRYISYRKKGSETLIACCMNKIAIKNPKSSPATLVNWFMMEHAPSIAIKNSDADVQMQTLHINSS